MPLAITEVALFPARFVEVMNTSEAAVDLTAFMLRVAPLSPTTALPGPDEGSALPWPQTMLAAGQRLAVPVAAGAPGLPADDGEREGVVTLFAGAAVVDRVDFMRWPTDAVLARQPDGAATLRFCTGPTPGAATTPARPCPPAPSPTASIIYTRPATSTPWPPATPNWRAVR